MEMLCEIVPGKMARKKVLMWGVHMQFFKNPYSFNPWLVDAEPINREETSCILWNQGIWKKSMAQHNLVNVLLYSQIIICSAGVIVNCLEIIQ